MKAPTCHVFHGLVQNTTFSAAQVMPMGIKGSEDRMERDFEGGLP